jgi:hypothetical protein
MITAKSVPCYCSGMMMKRLVLAGRGVAGKEAWLATRKNAHGRSFSHLVYTLSVEETVCFGEYRADELICLGL